MDGSYLDDLRNKRHNVGKLAHVHVEVLQLVAKRLLSDNLAPLSDCSQASQVPRRIELRVGRARQIDLEYGRGRERR